jgi:hypothetical protein
MRKEVLDGLLEVSVDSLSCLSRNYSINHIPSEVFLDIEKTVKTNRLFEDISSAYIVLAAS